MSTSIDDLPYNKPSELPSRDIPRETIHHVTDPQVTPIYIPPKSPEYIEHQPTSNPSKIDKWVEEFKVPILLSVLYFIFQLPLAQSTLKWLVPSCFIDGSLTTTGLCVKSGLFGVAYYGMMIVLEYLSKQ